MNLQKLEKDWIERGFSFGVGTIKANDGVDEADHENKDEVVVMESGKYEFIVGDETFIQEGNIEVLIPAGAKHSIKNIGTKDSKIYYGYKSINIYKDYFSQIGYFVTLSGLAAGTIILVNP